MQTDQQSERKDYPMAKKKKGFTLADLDKYRNRQGLLHVKATNPEEAPLWVPVNILDAKFTFGHVNLLVEPVGGKGQQWVDLKRLRFEG